MLLGDGGGRECLLGSDEFGERYLEALPTNGSGIVTGAVSEENREYVGLLLEKYVGGDGEGDGENGGES